MRVGKAGSRRAVEEEKGTSPGRAMPRGMRVLGWAVSGLCGVRGHWPRPAGLGFLLHRTTLPEDRKGCGTGRGSRRGELRVVSGGGRLTQGSGRRKRHIARKGDATRDAGVWVGKYLGIEVGVVTGPGLPAWGSCCTAQPFRRTGRVVARGGGKSRGVSCERRVGPVSRHVHIQKRADSGTAGPASPAIAERAVTRAQTNYFFFFELFFSLTRIASTNSQKNSKMWLSGVR
jgi:hypothetical protein